MRPRLRRVEQVEQNRELVLDAARRVFLAKGYGGASLEAIAEEAGFSKGVVYSQFDSKADLFFALLERRIAERAEQNEQIAREFKGTKGLEELFRRSERAFITEPEWALLVIEFRVHAARDRALNERYARAHARTVERFAQTVGKIHERAGLEPAMPPRTMAELILAIGIGVQLERIANPEAATRDDVVAMLVRAFAASPARKRRTPR